MDTSSDQGKDLKDKTPAPPQDPPGPPEEQEKGAPPEGGGRLKDLKNLQGKKKAGKKKGGKKKGGRQSAEDRAREEAQAQAEVQAGYTAIADQLLADGNKWCRERGLTPINPLQETLIKVGLVGTLMKYNLDIDEYPVLALAGGAAWTVADKLKELRQIRTKAGAEQEKKEPEAKPKKKGFFL